MRIHSLFFISQKENILKKITVSLFTQKREQLQKLTKNRTLKGSSKRPKKAVREGEKHDERSQEDRTGVLHTCLTLVVCVQGLFVRVYFGFARPQA